MPYISKEDRPPYDLALAQLKTLLKDKPKGHLTYVLYKIATDYVHSESYTTLSDARSSIGDAYDEFYRRKMAPYEDKKIIENGDV